MASVVSATPANAGSPQEEERSTADLVDRMEHEAAEERALHPPPPPSPAPSLAEAWLRTHEVGLSFGLSLDLAVLSFHAAADASAPAPEGCAETGGGRMRCEVVTAGGGSGRVNLAWQERFRRQGLWYFEPGLAGRLHYHFSHNLRVDAEQRASLGDGRDVGVGGALAAQLTAGVTPLFAPDVLLSLSLGPSLVYGETETAVGDLAYLTFGAVSAAELAVVWLVLGGGRFASFVSVEQHEALAVRAFGGRDVTRFKPALARVEAGLRATFAF